MLKIVETPAPVLTTPVKPVEKFDDSLKSLIADMEETLDAQTDPEGVGLAATQVGLSLAVFVMKPSKGGKLEVLVNPKIVSFGAQEKPKDNRRKMPLEGCLSIPRIWSPVKRPARVLVEYQDMDGGKTTKWFSGFKAVIVQHEVDHLQGILFTQRSLEQKSPIYEEKKGRLEKMANLEV